MLNPPELLDLARSMVRIGRGRPSVTQCARAISSIYYALFHCLARDCADLMIGGPGAGRSDEAWRLVYRALDHGPARTRCESRDGVAGFSIELRNFAEAFVRFQNERHRADYDPAASFSKTEVLTGADDVEVVMRGYRGAPAKERRAFCAYVLFKERLETRRGRR